LEQAFYNDGYRIANDMFEKDSSSYVLFQAMKQLYVVLDSFIAAFLKTAEESKTPAHCTKRCAYCCHQAVFAQSHEFKYLKRWMFDHLIEADLEIVRKKSKEKYKNTKALSPEEMLLYKEPCPLLDNDVCIAYEARPVACRIYLSYGLNSCKNDYVNPSDRSAFPQLFDLPFRAGQKLNEGYAARLKELGIQIEELRMEEGLERG
jgi:Fe-S-cluster containining protein